MAEKHFDSIRKKNWEKYWADLTSDRWKLTPYPKFLFTPLLQCSLVYSCLVRFHHRLGVSRQTHHELYQGRYIIEGESLSVDWDCSLPVASGKDILELRTRRNIENIGANCYFRKHQNTKVA